MIKNYLRIAFRNLLKQRGFSLINIIGLSVGLTCCILILLFIKDELSYDKFNTNADRICRVTLKGRIGDADFNMILSSAPLAFTFKNDLPEVENATRLFRAGIPVIRYKDKVFSEDLFFWADSTFFGVFTLPFIEGNPKTALTKPNSVVITESTSRKYFGSDKAVGKILNSDNRRDYIVTGVIKDIPRNSHFHFDMLGSLTTYPQNINNTSWISNNFITYLLLKKGTDLEKFQAKVDDVVEKFVAPQVKIALGVSFEELKKTGAAYRYILQPLTDIHLYSNLGGEIEPNGDIKYVYIFALIALGILLIACINFMNLSTARSAMRAKEVGIRKTLGSNKGQLVTQFIFESILMSTIAIFISYFLVEMMLPLFNNITGKEISFGLLSNFYTIPAFILFAVFVGLIAGSYPAFFLSSFDTVTVLKGGQLKGSRNSWLRSSLVVFQFAISIFLFIGTFIVSDQLDYMQNKKLGFNKEQVVLIKKTDDIGAQIESFKQELKQDPSIISVTNTTNYPGGDTYNNSVYKAGGASGEQTHLLSALATDYNFVETYQIPMAEGRYFSKEHPSDTLNAVVVNEQTIAEMGIKDPIGKTIEQIGSNPNNSRKLTIVGVTKNFNYESLHSKIKPLIIFLFNPRGYGRYVAVRIRPDNVSSTLGNISKIWHKLAGGQAFEYSFFDQEFAKLYQSEQRTSSIFTSFSALAIIIACMGLFGLVAFMTERRTKEIGIRKVLGASISEIVLLLSKESAKWVILSNILAWPLAYYVMNNWLKDFAYRIDIALWLFPLAGLLTLLIAQLTVSILTIRAAKSNPTNSLKYE